MRLCNELVKGYFTPYLKLWRKAIGKTQEKAAELLGRSPRAYANLERGRSGFSAYTLLVFLYQLTDEEIIRLVRGFGEWVLKAGERGAA